MMKKVQLKNVLNDEPYSPIVDVETLVTTSGETGQVLGRTEDGIGWIEADSCGCEELSIEDLNDILGIVVGEDDFELTINNEPLQNTYEVSVNGEEFLIDITINAEFGNYNITNIEAEENWVIIDPSFKKITVEGRGVNVGEVRTCSVSITIGGNFKKEFIINQAENQVTLNCSDIVFICGAIDEWGGEVNYDDFYYNDRYNNVNYDEAGFEVMVAYSSGEEQKYFIPFLDIIDKTVKPKDIFDGCSFTYKAANGYNLNGLTFNDRGISAGENNMYPREFYIEYTLQLKNGQKASGVSRLMIQQMGGANVDM